jgi:ketosteroid isomerase-like protein
MNREQAIQFVRELAEAVNAHDTPRLLTFYADDAVTVSPVSGGIVGREDISKSWDAIFSLFPDWTVSVHDVLLDGDRLAFFGSASATDRDGWFGQPPTGERFEYRSVIVLTLARGKIVRDERIYDLSGLLERFEKVRLEKELKLAADLQQILLSSTDRFSPFCEVVGNSIPSRAIAGDFFESVHLPSGDFAIALGDVAGKGPPAALLAAMIQGMLSAELQSNTSPSDILRQLNHLVARRNLPTRFCTLVCGVLSANGRLVYSNAGHNAPIVLNADGIRRMRVGGPVLGIFSQSTFAEETLMLNEGDTIVMFSDGVTEARDHRDQEFGEDRLISCLTASRDKPAAGMLDAILEAVRDFQAGAVQADDTTVVVAKFRRQSDMLEAL